MRSTLESFIAAAALALTSACGPELPDELGEEAADRALTAQALPGRLQAEAYATGGEGSGYHDTTAANLGGAYRGDAVDVQECADTGGGYNVGWTAAGEWLAYPVTVQVPGTFTFVARVASNTPAVKALHLEIDGVALPKVTSSLAAGWQSWSSLKLGSAQLSAGPHRVRLVHDTGGLNVNYLDVTEVRAPVRYGVSAVMPRSGQSWPQAYREQMTELGAQAVFYYFPAGVNPSWNANLASVPSEHDIMISTKVATPAAVQAFVNQVPRDRKGTIYFHYWQEPEDDFSTAADQQTYRERARAIAPIIKAHPRMKFGVELMQWSLKAASGRNWKSWVIPEMDFVGWSVYCGNGGDGDKVGDGKVAVDLVADAMEADGRPWGAFAWGCALNSSNFGAHDQQLRAKWVTDSAAELNARGSINALWFNCEWKNAGDYTIQNDPYLQSAWNAATK
ncbi:MAG: carbohydrate-binding protein [Archangiaceae bacterium]|nr:carbohydrate-binding protein [Archangiaceae bacterium]